VRISELNVRFRNAFEQFRVTEGSLFC